MSDFDSNPFADPDLSNPFKYFTDRTSISKWTLTNLSHVV